MFKETLIKWMTELYGKFADAGNYNMSNLLSIDLDGFNDLLYIWVETIMRNVIMPVAYVILALFFVLELWNIVSKLDGAGGGSMFAVEVVFKAILKLGVAKFAVDKTLNIIKGIYGVSQYIMSGVSGIMSPEAVTGSMNLYTIAAEINSMDMGAQIGLLIELLIIKFGVMIIMGIVQLICIGRFIEIYVYMAVAPIPIATLPSEEMSGIGKNFFKSFAAICLQGVFIYIILTFFPILVNSNILTDFNAFSMLLYSIMLVIAIMSSSRWAKSICSAM